jgi:xanthine dehydrogenase accessory factor
VSFIAGLSLVPAAGLVNQSAETRCDAKRVLHMTVDGKGRISVNGVFSINVLRLYNQPSRSLTMSDTHNTDLLAGRSLSAGEIYIEMKRRLDLGSRAAMATVVKTRGSTPQQVGAKMVIFDDGSFIGTVGGGCVEADIWAEAREVLNSGKTDIYHFNLNDEYEDSEGMVCGGQMDVLIERWALDE